MFVGFLNQEPVLCFQRQFFFKKFDMNASPVLLGNSVDVSKDYEQNFRPL